MDYYPAVNFHFRVDFDIGVDGVDIAFQEVSGIAAKLETTTVQEGGQNAFEYHLPVRARYEELVLRRGMAVESSLMDWCRQHIEQPGKVSPTTVTVSLLNEKHEPLSAWVFVNAFPVGWSLASLNAQNGEILIEELRLSYQHFVKQ